MSGLCPASRDAALVICGRSRDRDEATLLLGMCGLLDGDPVANPVAGPSSRSCAGCGLPMARNQWDYYDMCVTCRGRVRRFGDDAPLIPVQRPVRIAAGVGTPAVATASARAVPRRRPRARDH